MIDYIYDCKGKEIDLKENDKTKVIHGKYFVMYCDKCCNKTVLHMLRYKNAGKPKAPFDDNF